MGTSGKGLAQLVNGRVLTFTAADGLPDDCVEAIYQDADGAIWVGTLGGGLCQFKEVPVEVYSALNGLLHDEVHSVLESRDGAMWFGTAMGWSQWKDGLVTSPRWGRALRTSAIAEDPSGNLWFSTPFELARVRENRIETFKTGKFADHPIRTILPDHDGNIWVGTASGGLCRFRGGSCTDFTTKDGLAHNWVGNLYEDRAGAIWIATLGGVSRFKNGRITSWHVRDGLASNRVACFHEDRAGSLWIGTEGGGLSRFKDGRFANITVENGLYDNLAFQILEDDQQNLWMSCNRGIYRVSLKELNDFADGRIQMVTSYSYGIADGMLSRECNGGAPAGWKSRDGSMWFGSIRGAVAIDPRTVRASRP